MPSIFIQVTVNGFAIGLLYALVLLGILLIYNVSKVVNFSHGQFAMLGGLGSLYFVLAFGMPFWAAISLAVISAAIVAYLIQRLLVERLPVNLQGSDMVLTLGVFLALTALGENLLQQGPPRRYPSITEHSFTVLGAFIHGNVVIGMIVAVALFAGTFVVIKQTRLGQVLRACSQDGKIAETLGWNVGRIRALTWALAGIIAAIAGILIAFRVSVDSQYVTPIFIKAMIAGILGGMHRFGIPIATALGIGLVENWIGFLVGSEFRPPAVFILVILIMWVAPRDFLSTDEEEARA